VYDKDSYTVQCWAFFLSYFKHILQGFMRKKTLLGRSKDKLNIKEQKLKTSLHKLGQKRLKMIDHIVAS